MYVCVCVCVVCVCVYQPARLWKTGRVNYKLLATRRH